jgi:hypothetical protein
VWIKHGNTITLVPILNCRNVKRPLNTGTFVNRTNPYYLAKYKTSVLYDFYKLGKLYLIVVKCML